VRHVFVKNGEGERLTCGGGATDSGMGNRCGSEMCWGVNEVVKGMFLPFSLGS
jgi:hypothetical protein